MFKLVFFLILISNYIEINSTNLNYFNSSRAACSFLGRRDHQQIRTSHVIMMTVLSQLVMFIFFVILVLIIFAKNFLCHIYYVRFDLDLSLSCHKRLWDAHLSFLFKDLSKLLLFASITCLIMTNPVAVLLTITDFTPTHSLRKIVYLFCNIKTKFHNYLFLSILFKWNIIIKILRIFYYSFSYRPHDCFALWYIFLSLSLSKDIHPNPGPYSEFSSSFLTFCNWNLNSISKDDFYRVSLLEAHNTVFNYDIISLCETSLNATVNVKENILPGYHFVSQNNPDGSKNGGVGIFYKESLPLRIRQDLSFGECLVSEIMFGRKKIFFSVLYRNPAHKASSIEFNCFTDNLEKLTNQMRSEKPYAIFFTGDFNAHSQTWFPEGDTNPEGYLLDELFSSLNLNQIISEATHFFRNDCLPSCIDLVVTDQPNLVLESGVRPSLDPTVKHQLIIAKINHRIPSPS